MDGDLHIVNFRSDLGDSLVATDGVIEDIGRSVAKPTGHETLDLDGAVLLPGFIDAHAHVQAWGLRLFAVDLSGASSWVEALSLLERNEGSVLGIDYDESGWSDVMRVEDLDDVGFPVVLRRVCGHRAVASEEALTRIERDHPWAVRDGGITERGALELFSIFDPGPEARVRAARYAAETAMSLGITTVHEIAHDVGALKRADVPLRWTAYRVLDDGPIRRSDDFAGIKLFADGSIGSRTAWMTEEYTDGGTGMPYTDHDDIVEAAGCAADLGLQVMTHAIGDAAVGSVVRAYADVADGHDPVRPRIEHLELVPDSARETLRRIGAVASMQPNFTVNWGMPGGMYETALGGRYASANAYRRALDLHLAFGSDCMPMGPLYGMRGALEHPDPDARLDIGEAVRAYTEGGAYAAMMEGSLGAIASGMECDLVVLNGPPPGGGVLVTVIAGEVVFRRE